MSLLEGRRVLLVEDESLVAMLAEDMLLDLGCEVVTAMRLDKALGFAREAPFDLAVLDVNLGNARSYPIADLLFARSVPFLFATGYGEIGLDLAYQAVPVVQKPYQAGHLEQVLLHLLTCEMPAQKGVRPPALPCGCGVQTASPKAQFRADPLG